MFNSNNQTFSYYLLVIILPTNEYLSFEVKAFIIGRYMPSYFYTIFNK